MLIACGLPLPFTSQVPFIGRVAEKLCSRVLGASTCGELLAALPEAWCLFSPMRADALFRDALGWDDADAGGEAAPQKGISFSDTFRASDEPRVLRQMLRRMCEGLGKSMESVGLRGTKMTCRFKDSNFEVRSRAAPELSRPIGTADELYRRALPMLEKELSLGGGVSSAGGTARAGLTRKFTPLKLRSIGVQMTKLSQDGAPVRDGSRRIDQLWQLGEQPRGGAPSGGAGSRGLRVNGAPSWANGAPSWANGPQWGSTPIGGLEGCRTAEDEDEEGDWAEEMLEEEDAFQEGASAGAGPWTGAVPAPPVSEWHRWDASCFHTMDEWEEGEDDEEDDAACDLQGDLQGVSPDEPLEAISAALSGGPPRGADAPLDEPHGSQPQHKRQRQATLDRFVEADPGHPGRASAPTRRDGDGGGRIRIPADVQILIDMGFEASAARATLQRCPHIGAAVEEMLGRA
jgi:hypothetical protein